jgi:hypothetical protein
MGLRNMKANEYFLEGLVTLFLSHRKSVTRPCSKRGLEAIFHMLEVLKLC